MRLVAAIACLTLACLLPAGSATARGGALRANLTSCTTGPLATDRAATVVGTMPRIKGAARMEMRFALLQKRPGDVYTRVAVPKWGSWVRSQPGVPSFSYERRIEQLAAPAVYRVHVRFRWRSASGAVIRNAQRWSQVCEQPDYRPDLAVGTLTTAPGDRPGTTRYDIVVRNIGRSDVTSAFQVTLGTATEPIGAVSLTNLQAGDSARVSITGAPCTSGQRLRVLVDAGGAVDEAVERNNAASRTCP